MNITKRTSILATTLLSASLFVGLVIPAEAEAARWRTCNSSPVKWRGTLNIHRNRCSIPDTGIVNSAYWNGVLQWDRLSSVSTGSS